MRILSEHAEYLSVKFFPEEYDWERAKEEYNKTIGVPTVVDDIFFDSDLSHFSFKITLGLKDFGEDYLRQLKE